LVPKVSAFNQSTAFSTVIIIYYLKSAFISQAGILFEIPVPQGINLAVNLRCPSFKKNGTIFISDE
jgi:hypothetical protein